MFTIDVTPLTRLPRPPSGRSSACVLRSESKNKSRLPRKKAKARTKRWQSLPHTSAVHRPDFTKTKDYAYDRRFCAKVCMFKRRSALVSSNFQWHFNTRFFTWITHELSKKTPPSVTSEWNHDKSLYDQVPRHNVNIHTVLQNYLQRNTPKRTLVNKNTFAVFFNARGGGATTCLRHVSPNNV